MLRFFRKIIRQKVHEHFNQKMHQPLSNTHSNFSVHRPELRCIANRLLYRCHNYVFHSRIQFQVSRNALYFRSYIHPRSTIPRARTAGSSTISKTEGVVHIATLDTLKTTPLKNYAHIDTIYMSDDLRPCCSCKRN